MNCIPNSPERQLIEGTIQFEPTGIFTVREESQDQWYRLTVLSCHYEDEPAKILHQVSLPGSIIETFARQFLGRVKPK